MNATIEHIQAILSHAQVWPIAIRVGMTALHHYFHGACHKGIHGVAGRFHRLHQALKKHGWLMDVALIACLLVFSALTEHEGGHEEHE